MKPVHFPRYFLLAAAALLGAGCGGDGAEKMSDHLELEDVNESQSIRCHCNAEGECHVVINGFAHTGYRSLAVNGVDIFEYGECLDSRFDEYGEWIWIRDL